ncbi:DNA replication/repair protein RecF [Panacibacter sp. DH6]|uniref:DNA replication and repair protein RecF n=1 Tax=Panacibacter microcysteis TaxID=2793269 RepID=A0A931E9E6_9BACT|nr:DNA replication and repair protein RecF [Panacibacter microcysteis]MBG9377584.1 DNA replication/repair protein RecF [Panacibacter microcysteis]
MMRFTNIGVAQFRNYLAEKFVFTERIVAICGNNGTGKTNLLDAVYYLCFTKSYFSKPDAQSVYQQLRGFRIEGEINSDNAVHEAVCILRETNRKEFLLDEAPYKKFSQHIGKFPCVFIAPDDVEIITGGSELRRNFIDTIIAQADQAYLLHLIDYKKLLEERNALLKAAAEKNYLDETLLNIIDTQLQKSGSNIFQYRHSFLGSFIPEVQRAYQYIANSDDSLSIKYDSQLINNSFGKLLEENRQRDLYLQRTSAGVHKDDLEIAMSGQPFKTMASQGQRKSLLFALKLAEFEILKQKKGFAPLLLLDDIFEKLDNQRMNNLLAKVCIEENGQVFITDTHRDRLETALNNVGVAYQLIGL